MANIMTMKKLQNKTSRNGFDLSNKISFSAKVGELLPCACIECVPGDSFQIKTKHLTRTMPVNTAAFTRIREYYDWFFVPTNLLWNKFNTFVTQMGDNKQTAASISDTSKIGDQHPYFTFRHMYQYLAMIENTQENLQVNAFGFKRGDNTRKLLEYLDYGSFYDFDGTKTTLDAFPTSFNPSLNPFPLLAYQKIYSDYFRHSQWEDSLPSSFNLNYVNGVNDLLLPITSLNGGSLNMFDLRYANWHKDYFMGLLPNSQYGDVASVNISSLLDNYQTVNISFANSSVSSDVTTNASGSLQAGTNPYWSITDTPMAALANGLGINSGSLIGAFSILALRNAEAMQKWAEITQSQQQDYQSQVDAHFGVKVSDAYSERCTWIGGGDSTIDISEVVNTNITGDNEADIAGKGVGVGDDFCKFETKVHGYLMCIYHAVPLLDYAITGIPKRNLKTFVTDYAIPEFDKTGMVSVPSVELQIPQQGVYNLADLLGYAPRYYDYKTSYDRVKGAFVHGGLQSWVAPVTSKYLSDLLGTFQGGNGELNYNFFKVNPSFLNPIFAADAGDTTDTDQLRVNTYFDIKSVRNLDRDGLPYN